MIQVSEVLSNEEYEKIRTEYRQKIFAVKETRRIQVGPYLTFLFENHDTMLYQVQEMMRAEKIKEESAIRHEVETYNQLVPSENELKATLLLEFVDENVRRVKLHELLGLEEHIWLMIRSLETERKVRANFDQAQYNEEKLSSVQYLTFKLGEAADLLRSPNSTIAIETTHTACSYRQELSTQQMAALRSDIK